MDPDATAPLVSVLTTSYNHARWLQDTLDSVERQDYPHLEHIVVDDGSTDASVELLSAAGGRLCWSSTPHLGQAGALNEAFRRSTGQIIGWLSSDDAYYDRAVVRHVVEAFRRHPDAGVVYGHAVLVDESGLQLHAEWVPPPEVLGRHPPMQIYQPATFVRRSAIGDAFVDESFDVAMDTELWQRVGETHRLVRLDRILAVERHQPSRKSYLLGSTGAEEVRRLDRSNRPAGGRTINRRNRAWGIAYRLAGLTLIPRMARIPTAFEGRLDGRVALIRRQIAVPRSRMASGRRPMNGDRSGTHGPALKTALTRSVDGIWKVVYRSPAVLGGPGLFLDRDGVLVDDVGYLHRPTDVRLLPGAAELVRAANRAGVVVVVVTNQAGIGRGYYDWADFEAVRHRIDDLLAAEGVRLDAVYACPFHPAALEPYRHASHPGRKPGPGMLFRAASDLGIDLSMSWIVGDVVDDIEAGRSAGLAGAVHVRSGHGARDRDRVAEGPWAGFDVRLVEGPGDVVERIPILAARP